MENKIQKMLDSFSDKGEPTNFVITNLFFPDNYSLPTMAVSITQDTAEKLVELNKSLSSFRRVQHLAIDPPKGLDFDLFDSSDTTTADYYPVEESPAELIEKHDCFSWQGVDTYSVILDGDFITFQCEMDDGANVGKSFSNEKFLQLVQEMSNGERPKP